VLLAVMAGMYAVYYGPKGLKYIADKVHRSTVTLCEALESLGYQQHNTSYFDTLLIDADAAKIRPLAEAQQINFLYPQEDKVAISLNETVSLRDLNTIVQVFAQAAGRTAQDIRSEERRVGKECRCRWARQQLKRREEATER